jgi:hypothetical protein
LPRFSPGLCWAKEWAPNAWSQLRSDFSALRLRRARGRPRFNRLSWSQWRAFFAKICAGDPQARRRRRSARPRSPGRKSLGSSF